ncbi:MAG: methyltransferase [Fibromonadaceae bacterium]|jgi:tRNA (guanine-N7-)-methyltransferase|nr:methyltransferase [Fibromonadaceae bacterium]
MREFLKKFYKGEIPFLWHYMPELDSISQKPIPLVEARKPAPLLLENLFECERKEKFILEIGSGKGAFMCEYAQKFPDTCILGVEWDNYCANATARKIAKFKLKNAAVIRGDLFYLLKNIVPPNSIDEIHTYFPDPWPKRRQQKNRLILRQGFLELLHKALKLGNRLFYWATDHAEYNALVLQTFKNFPNTKILEENTALPTYGIETGFEKKYKKEGRAIFRSVIELRIES